MSTVHDPATAVAGERERTEFLLTDAEQMCLSHTELQSRRAEIEDVATFALHCGLTVVRYRDPVRMADVTAIVLCEGM